jgi:hypothetical protein
MALNLRGSFLRPLFTVVCFTAAVFVTLPASAQQTALHPRVTAQIDNSRRAALAGSRTPMALAANGHGGG